VKPVNEERAVDKEPNRLTINGKLCDLRKGQTSISREDVIAALQGSTGDSDNLVVRYTLGGRDYTLVQWERLMLDDQVLGAQFTVGKRSAIA